MLAAAIFFAGAIFTFAVAISLPQLGFLLSQLGFCEGPDRAARDLQTVSAIGYGLATR
jgi:hypothetical protein